jgi:PKD repeat protein
MFPTGMAPAAIAVGDFNNDGKLDLVTADSASNTISALLGNGNGTFQKPIATAVGPTPLAVAVGDFNHDGNLDVAVATSVTRVPDSGQVVGSELSVLLGNGNGTFQKPTNYFIEGTADALTVANLNDQTGPPDIAVASTFSSTDSDGDLVTVFHNNGDGTFTNEGTQLVGFGVNSVAAGDLDGIAPLDLATANETDNTATILLGTGNGEYQRQFPDPPAGSGAASITIADLNGDGKQDLAVADATGNTVSVLLGNGNGTFAPLTSFPVDTGPQSIAAVDLNGDGKLDLITANSTGNDVSVLLGNGDGTFQSVLNFPAGTGPSSLAVGDFNGDGLPDVAVADSSTNSVSILINDTHLMATGTSITATEGAAFTATVATFTDTDPAGTNSDNTATIAWGDGTTSAGTIVAQGNGQYNVVGQHTYAEEGKYSVTVTISDPGGSTVTATSTATVADAPLTATGTTTTAVEGMPYFNVIATFTDANPNASVLDFSATAVAAGVGPIVTSIGRQGNGFEVLTSVIHFPEEGAVDITVTITDIGGSQGVAHATVNVADAPLSITPSLTVCAFEGKQLNMAVLATFTDTGGPEPVENYSATVDYGDGTSPAAAQIVQNGSAFEVLGSHTYAAEGNYTLTVSVSAEGGAATNTQTRVSTSLVVNVTGYVTSLYLNILGRQPDATGLNIWVQQLHAGTVTREQVAEAFWVSPEHRGDEVDQFYLQLLHRPADAAGRAIWVNALLSGVPEANVVVDFLTSPEYTASHPDTGSFINGLYADIFGRPADPQGAAFWFQILQSGDRNRGDVAFYFLSSDEAYRQAINAYYETYLGRAPDAMGEQDAFNDLVAGQMTVAQLVGRILASEEYLIHIQAVLCPPM